MSGRIDHTGRVHRAGDKVWRALVVLYLGGILSANAMAAKLIDVLGLCTITAGALAIPLVYLTTDTINELYGARATRAVVWMGFWANAVLVVMTIVCGAVPASPLGATQEQFDSIFNLTWRIVLGSQCAYLVSSLIDVSIFAWLRELTKERHFWLRKNGSTLVSQAVDTSVFVLIAWAGVIPWRALLPMAIGQYLVKMLAAPLGTPLSYLAIRFIRSPK